MNDLPKLKYESMAREQLTVQCNIELEEAKKETNNAHTQTESKA